MKQREKQRGERKKRKKGIPLEPVEKTTDD
jgi:hypothetical protein